MHCILGGVFLSSVWATFTQMLYIHFKLDYRLYRVTILRGNNLLLTLLQDLGQLVSYLMLG